MKSHLIVKGARVHNLKSVDVAIPRNKFTVITGLSGSGKSSLAFDTIYAEGQRRYVESLSSYARQFLGQMEKPDIDFIDGLSPAISIDQKTTSRNPRSTVGTVTEIYDYLRLLYARAGTPHCPKCGRKIEKQTIDQILDQIMAYPEGSRILVLAPKVRQKKGDHKKLLEDATRGGYVRARVDGEVLDIGEFELDKNKRHTIEIVVDRLVVRPGTEGRLADSLETAASLGDGVMIVYDMKREEDALFSLNYKCEHCGISQEEPEPKLFSFNNPMGACPDCSGIGYTMHVEPEYLIPDRHLSLRQGAIQANGWVYSEEPSMANMYFDGIAKAFDVSLDVPVKDLSEKELNLFLYGTDGVKFPMRYKPGDKEYVGSFEGVIPNLLRRYNETSSDGIREYVESIMVPKVCSTCHGARLKREALAVKIGNKNISEFTELNIEEAIDFLKKQTFSPRFALVAEKLIGEVLSRLSFLRDVGLGYLTLSRGAGTLSGGESQRIRLTTQLGSALTGVLYILDEPSIGLHQRDNDKLIATLKHLRDIGNTVLVVEHDEETMRQADFLVDVGPGAGAEGGKIVSAGTPAEVAACETSLTGRYLSGRESIPVPKERRKGNGKYLTVKGAQKNNLKNISVSFPLGKFICVTGVSGSGKSTLIHDILYQALQNHFGVTARNPGRNITLEGVEAIDKVIHINQSPIGRSPRSNPATYTGFFTDIRELFATMPEAKARGYGKGRFSFNVKGGRCEACEGDGLKKIEMNFLADVYVPCEVCRGKRYNRETLEVKYKGKTISDVLDMTVADAVVFFENMPRLRAKIQTLLDVGLGYMTLGQTSTTISGGEAQRVKLATELLRPATGKTFYILDEPTTGLHSEDVKKLIGVLNRLVDAGNTVLVIEHNLDVIKTADHIIDLGPEGGENGGRVIAQGTPEQVAMVNGSYTGKYLRKMLGI
ncbi:MAG: excinuclease ABC subunit UvrA [Clostridia bacterium]|nr:excinuclease ABC subunit UvrA [Clostridia bacterium]